jgi:hypothetical protein
MTQSTDDWPGAQLRLDDHALHVPRVRGQPLD